MSYIEVAELKDYLGITITTDDPLLGMSIDAARSYIDSRTNRHFEAETVTKYYDRSALNRWESRLLDLLGDD